MNKYILYILFAGCALCACQDTESLTENEVQSLIQVGGIALADELDVAVETTRATVVDAETQNWLVGPLKSGLDITYGIASDKSTEKVAILKLTDTTGDGITLAGEEGNKYAVDATSGWAIYSFKYRTDNTDAQWYGNGAHYFEGVYVPDNIRYGAGATQIDGVDRSDLSSVNETTAPNITTDQHEDGESANYTLLERYLGMPANTRLSATVARVKLPFRHRLARVLAYVLIDPTMGESVKLEGYKKSIEDNKTDVDTEDPTNTKIRFCNVNVLTGVNDQKLADNHHTLTPQWAEKRKVIPHFVAERASLNSQSQVVDADAFIVYFNTKTDTYIFPTNDADWIAAKNAYNAKYEAITGEYTEQEKAEKAAAASGYRKINYGKVPVYDLIVRPTYTSVDKVMYDEDGVKNTDGTENATKKQEYFSKTNKIDFDITLNNGLQYVKEFNFDLDPNYQTVVYLRISRESVDYNSSGSELWVSSVKEDDWYGVDNTGEHSLSDAGSSWQRAYTAGTTVGGDKVTDGGYYNETTSTDVNSKGQYLKDETWIEYFCQAYKGGAHHGDYFTLKKNEITIDASRLPINFVFTGHLDAQDNTIILTNANKWVTCTNEVLALLSHKTGDDSYESVPQLYFMREIAQVPGKRSAGSIDKGEPFPINMNQTKPSDLDGMTLFTKNGDVYEVYPNRTFYKKTGGALFYGLDGVYTTVQEEKEAAGGNIYSIEWEANVHKENNVWVPYRDVSDADASLHTGWRAEVLNLKLKGTMFETDAVITGNVQNCHDGKNGNIKVKDHIPAIPKYK